MNPVLDGIIMTQNEVEKYKYLDLSPLNQELSRNTQDEDTKNRELLKTDETLYTLKYIETLIVESIKRYSRMKIPFQGPFKHHLMLVQNLKIAKDFIEYLLEKLEKKEVKK